MKRSIQLSLLLILLLTQLNVNAIAQVWLESDHHCQMMNTKLDSYSVNSHAPHMDMNNMGEDNNGSHDCCDNDAHPLGCADCENSCHSAMAIIDVHPNSLKATISKSQLVFHQSLRYTSPILPSTEPPII